MKKIKNFYLFLTEVIFPDSIFKIIFDLFSMLIILFEIMEIPILISFNDEIEVPDLLLKFHLFFTIYFFVEIILNFNTGFYKKGF